MGWIGVDLDGTLAHYDGWRDPTYIGPPVPKMLARVKAWLAEGKEVRIYTARVATKERRELVVPVIDEWCLQHLGCTLPVTNAKDPDTEIIWDDRCVQVRRNTGEPVGSGEYNDGQAT